MFSQERSLDGTRFTRAPRRPEATRPATGAGDRATRRLITFTDDNWAALFIEENGL